MTPCRRNVRQKTARKQELAITIVRISIPIEIISISVIRISIIIVRISISVIRISINGYLPSFSLSDMSYSIVHKQHCLHS